MCATNIAQGSVCVHLRGARQGKSRNEVNGCIVLANFLNALTMHVCNKGPISSGLLSLGN